MEQLSEDLADPASAKAAFAFLGRGVAVWGQVPLQAASSTEGAARPSGGLPGFERFIYDQLIPSAFKVVSLPEFNIKDGQMLTVSLLSSP
jgi:exportin-T